MFHVSKFLEKMVFWFMFEIIKWIRQLQVRRQNVPNYWHQIGNFFWPEHVFLKGCFSFKIEDLVFAWFWPDCLCIPWKYRRQIFLKNLKTLEQRYSLNLSETGSQLIFSQSFIPMWLLLSIWRQYPIHLFRTVWNLLWNFYSDLDTKLSRHNQNVVELNHCTRVVLDKVLSICFSCKGI